MLYTLTDAKEQALHTESKTESAGREKIILNIIYFIYVHFHDSTIPFCGKVYFAWLTNWLVVSQLQFSIL